MTAGVRAFSNTYLVGRESRISGNIKKAYRARGESIVNESQAAITHTLKPQILGTKLGYNSESYDIIVLTHRAGPMYS